VRLALAAALAVTAAALAAVLMRPPLTAVAGSNGIPADPAVAFIRRGDVVNCQPGGTVPKGTEAIRVSLSANIGPKVSLKVLSGSTVVTEGERDAGWGADETVTVPVARVARSIPEAGICTTVGLVVEPVQVNGTRVRTAGEPEPRSCSNPRIASLAVSCLTRRRDPTIATHAGDHASPSRRLGPSTASDRQNTELPPCPEIEAPSPTSPA
jgi:hypothetical protein